MKRKFFSFPLAILSFVMPAFADSVTLNSGEVLDGRVLSESSDQIQIEVSNASKTIFTTRTISKSEIRRVNRDTEEQKHEKQEFEQLAKFKLDPNQEVAKNECEQGIAAFETFLRTHPSSTHAGEVKECLVRWQEEKAHLELGQVKFTGKWMSPGEKEVKARAWRKQQEIQKARNQLQTLKGQLAKLDTERSQLVKGLPVAEGNLRHTQSNLDALLAKKEPVYEDRLVRAGHWNERWNGIAYVQYWVNPVYDRRMVGERTVPNPEIPKLEQSVAFFAGQVGEGKARMPMLDSQIEELRRRIDQAEQVYNTSLSAAGE